MNDILSKRPFGKSKREKWAGIFILCAGVILVANLFVPSLMVSPFLTYLGMIGTTFILGKSVDSYVQGQAARDRMNQPVVESVDEGVVVDKNIEFADDPSYAPAGWDDDEEEGDFR